MKSRIGFLVVALCMLLAGCGGSKQALAPLPSALPTQASSAELAAAATAAPTATPTARPTAAPTPTPAPKPTEINLMAVGDVMFQYFEIASAYDKATKSYDFNYSFKYMKDILSGADLAMGNFECTLGGKPPYSQRASIVFNAPDSAADALKTAGFDLLSTANNHMNNTGAAGILYTQQALGDRGIACAGTRKEASDKPYVIENVKGIKVGVTAYSWCTRLSGGRYELDYEPVDKSVAGLVNVFAYKTLDRDLADMAKVAQRMRSDGAEIVIFYLHWGTEYTRTVSDYQKKMARALAAAGVDVILGCHPHWLQTVDELPNGKTGGKTVVAYSLGNFFSCQRAQFTAPGYNFKYSEDCMILNLQITKQPGFAATVNKVEYLPAWTFMYTPNGKRCFTVLPLEKAIEDPKAYGLTGKRDVQNAQKSFDNTQKLLADAVAKGYLSLMKAD